MAYVTRGIRQKMKAAALSDRGFAALEKYPSGNFVAVPFEWQTKQTDLAVLFPSYGWIPRVAIRWRRADGAIVPWESGRNGDEFLIDRKYLGSGR